MAAMTRLLIGTKRGLFTADTADGGRTWTLSPPLLAGHEVYHAFLDARDGRELWGSPARIDGQIVASPVLFNMGSIRALAVPSSEEGVAIIHAGNGSEIGALAARAGVKASPAVRDGIIFVHTLDDELIAYSAADLTRRACVNVHDPARRC
jgi:outer membrane protein assembly factor BamB